MGAVAASHAQVVVCHSSLCPSHTLGSSGVSIPHLPPCIHLRRWSGGFTCQNTPWRRTSFLAVSERKPFKFLELVTGLLSGSRCLLPTCIPHSPTPTQRAVGFQRYFQSAVSIFGRIAHLLPSFPDDVLVLAFAFAVSSLQTPLLIELPRLNGYSASWYTLIVLIERDSP